MLTQCRLIIKDPGFWKAFYLKAYYNEEKKLLESSHFKPEGSLTPCLQEVRAFSQSLLAFKKQKEDFFNQWRIALFKNDTMLADSKQGNPFNLFVKMPLAQWETSLEWQSQFSFVYMEIILPLSLIQKEQVLTIQFSLFHNPRISSVLMISEQVLLIMTFCHLLPQLGSAWKSYLLPTFADYAELADFSPWRSLGNIFGDMAMQLGFNQYSGFGWFHVHMIEFFK